MEVGERSEGEERKGVREREREGDSPLSLWREREGDSPLERDWCLLVLVQ